MSHLRFCRAIKLRDIVARYNCRCDIGLTYWLASLCYVQLDLCLTVVCGQGHASEMLILIANSTESYQQWLKLLQSMTGTVVDDIGKEYVAMLQMLQQLWCEFSSLLCKFYSTIFIVLWIFKLHCLMLNFKALIVFVYCLKRVSCYGCFSHIISEFDNFVIFCYVSKAV